MSMMLSFLLVMAGLMLALTDVASAQTLEVSQQIKVTAVILPARHVTVDADDKILQIISNTSQPDIEPIVYLESIRPENIVPLDSDLSAKIDDLLVGKTLKPGVLYDYRNAAVLPAQTVGYQPKANIWLSGIFNLKNINPTVNLTRL